MSFEQLGLSEPLLRAVQAAGYETPSEIQDLAIPPILSGSDVLGRAKTGSGKTAAFILPILDRLCSSSVPDKHAARKRRGRVRALVLAPTRELAQQIHDSTRKYGRFINLRSDAQYGGVSIEPQIDRLRHGLDILTATPGRLLDHLQRGTVDLSACEVLIVDEADRMFDMGFMPDVKRIIAQLPTQRQTLLFSATINDDVRKLTALIMHDPVRIEIGIERSPVESVRQRFVAVEKEDKTALLFDLLEGSDMESVLVFSRTKYGADKISKRLGHSGIASAVLHANRSQNQRLNALDDFKRGRVRVLIATDIAARGIDVQGISHVINYDTPTYAEDYIHRIGRTGRAEATGDAITFVARDERIMLKRIESFTGLRFSLVSSEGETLPDRNAYAREAQRRGGERNAQQRSSGKPEHGKQKGEQRRGSEASRKVQHGSKRVQSPVNTETGRESGSEIRQPRQDMSSVSERPRSSDVPKSNGHNGKQRRTGKAESQHNEKQAGHQGTRGDTARKRISSNIPEWAVAVARPAHKQKHNGKGKNNEPAARSASDVSWSLEYGSTHRGGKSRKVSKTGPRSASTDTSTSQRRSSRASTRNPRR
jgi:ATP-dependent RNA helicase RhlE